jgi:hypothetical protein
MTENRHMQVLPDSTGRRLHLAHHYELNYDGATGTFNVGDVVVGESSNVSATINRVIVVTSTAGTLLLTLSLADQDSDNSFTNNENLQVNAVTIALANGTGVATFAQSLTLESGDNSTNRAIVDEDGAIRITAAEGSPVVGAYGSARVSEASLLKSYDFTYSSLPVDFSIVSGSGASESYVSGSRAVLFSNPTTSGSSVSKTSNLYHKAPAGNGVFVQIGAAVGDAGKANVLRCWGMYDDTDGVFFRLSGSSFSFVVRENTTGVVQETVISQSAFNVDRVDGAGDSLNRSLLDHDPSKASIYWIEYKHLGAGSIRFGTWIGNKRITFHEAPFGNSQSDTWLGKASLPVRVEQVNEDTSASTSEFRFYGAAVFSDGEFIPEEHAQPVSYTLEDKLVTNDITALFTIKPSTTFQGRPNRRVGLLKTLLCSSVNNSDGITDSRLRVLMYSMATLSGSTFAAQPMPFSQSAFVIDTAGELSSSFLPVESFSRIANFTTKGTHTQDVSFLQNYQGSGLLLNADGTDNPITIAAQCTQPGVTASVDFTITWAEVVD